MDTLDRLEQIIRQRRGADAGSSYTASLFARGRTRIAQKLGEEAVELVIAAIAQPGPIAQPDPTAKPATIAQPNAVASEAADLMFHLLVLLADADLSLDDVRAELDRREGVSGHDEKTARSR